MSLWILAKSLDKLTDAKEPTVNEDGEEQERPANADEGAFDGPTIRTAMIAGTNTATGGIPGGATREAFAHLRLL